MPKKAKLARAPTYIQRPRVWQKVGPVERRTMEKAGKPSRSIHPHLPHRSRTAIAGNPIVCEHNSSGLPILDRFFSEYNHLRRSRSRPRDSSSKQERTEYRRRRKIELEVDRVCHGQTVPPRGQRLRRRFRSTQICRRGSLFHSGKLRGKVPSLRMYHPRSLQAFQRTKENEQAIELLAPRVKALSVLLCTSVSEGDFKEQERRRKLERYAQTLRGRDPSLTDRDRQGT